MTLWIFEDEAAANFHPLTFTRPVFALRCGATSLADKIVRAYPEAEVAYGVRSYLAAMVATRRDAPVNDSSRLAGDLLLVNGRWLFPQDAPPLEGPEEIGMVDDVVAYARVRAATAAKCAQTDVAAFLADARSLLPMRNVSARLVSYPWHLIDHNPTAIVEDFAQAGRSGIEGEFADLSTVFGPKDQAYVAPGASVHPFVVLDTRGGPVTIESGATIFPHTRIEGPSYIGRDTQIVGGKIREGCSIGPVCRIGGEVEESIIHGYGEVSVLVNGEMVKTGSTKVGCFVGDHTKTSIGTIFNTGAVVGIASIVLTGGGVLPRYVPSFAWYLAGTLHKGPFKAFLETARRAMLRRNVELTQEEIDMLAHVREMTREERVEAVRKSRRATF
jgi:carbonic anhydrase/acetyltransferase-like protein (isoleucine patch superfamily)